jgi:isopentenyldiphosphate isomerase
MIEFLDLVDEQDNVIGIEERNLAFQKGRKNIRVINIFIYTSENKIIVPLRSENRRIFPNCYDFSVGGFVTSGDSYEFTAYKELEEELGIKNVLLEEIGYFNPQDINTACFSKLYKLVYDGPINYDKNGISAIYYFSEDEIIDKLNKMPEKFKGDYEQLFKWMLESKKTN